MREQRRFFLFILTSLFFLCGFSSNAQIFETEEYLSWQIITKTTESEIPSPKILFFTNASLNDLSLGTGEYIRQINVNNFNEVRATLVDEVYAGLSKEEEDLIKYDPPTVLAPKAVVRSAAGIPAATVSFIPLRTNPETGQIEKLVSFSLKVIELPGTATQTGNQSRMKNAEASKLASGNWYKIGVTATGVYKIDYNLLNKIGIDPAATDPRKIKIYGKPGGVLPQLNSTQRDEDLVENAIFIQGQEDGSFNTGDYILFYAKGPVTWRADLENKTFIRQANYFSDTAYYFITVGSDAGKRIADKASVAGQPDMTVAHTYDYAWHEFEQETDISKNIKGGRDWYGEEFSQGTSKQFGGFSFPDIDNSYPASIKVNLAARAPGAGNFGISINGAQVMVLNHDAVPTSYPSEYAMPNKGSGIGTFNTGSDNLSVGIVYSNPYPSALAWLNYIELVVRRNLRFVPGKQLEIRNLEAMEPNLLYKYQLGNANGNLKIWDVTDFHEVSSQQYNLAGSDAVFQATQTEKKLREYVAFDGSTFLTPAASGKVSNQNLHGLSQAEMLIVTYPAFKDAADRLADFHRQHDNFTVHVVTPQQIYNEFSSGSQDITAIRDFARMFYNRAGANGKKPRYLLFFGDASYDYKDRVAGNTNFVPTYQSGNSLHPFQAYASDDYYGFLDDNEGDWENGQGVGDKIDLAIGRLPVTTKKQADDMVEKIKRYHAPEAMGDWRNIATFVADDEDSNQYFNDAEKVDKIISQDFKTINVQKIYLDAFKQKTTSGGNTYPDVNSSIQRRIESGTLVFTYIGHGHELGMAHEKIVQISDIQGWQNKYKMPLFITATCELSRFDDPGRTSAGELALLNNEGGAIALFSTTRVVYAHDNSALNVDIVNDNLFKKVEGRGQRLGDIFVTAKNLRGFATNTRNFILLGDPAVRIALPENDVVITSINGKSPGEDTLKALSFITISGEIQSSGVLLNDFNGIIYPTVYDKEATKRTLANDPGSIEAPFQVRENVIYKGSASVVNGKFSFSFYVPKDINFQDGFGKISFYADNNAVDASGYNTDIVVGSASSNPIFDETGPKITLYINDTTFRQGGLVDQNPVILGYVSDDYGINTTGNGVGHDITMTINNDEPLILNENYESLLNDYRQGVVTYPLYKLPDGHYFIKMKVWDINNNSAEAFTDFIVANSAKFALDKIFNYPNPFTDKTYFQFEHNRPGENLDVSIRIFDINGKIIKTLHSVVSSKGNKIQPIEWNGLADGNSPITSGIYIYRISVGTQDGQKIEHAERLVYIK